MAEPLIDALAAALLGGAGCTPVPEAYLAGAEGSFLRARSTSTAAQEARRER